MRSTDITTELPIIVTLNDELKELTLHLRFEEHQWPDIKELADGSNIKLKILSFIWEKVKQ